jgi:plasmid maintenance system antidote protein VapI
MNTNEFLAKYGREEALKVSAKAGTSYAYFTQLVSGNRRPSPELASRLVEASDGRLDFACLLQSHKKIRTTKQENRNATTQAPRIPIARAQLPGAPEGRRR